MKVGFICPDGTKVKFDECFNACRLGNRCIKCVNLLRDMSWTPPQNEKFSVTTLIQPTRMAYLQCTCDYYINPQEQAFSLLGTRVHRRIELGKQDNALMETPLEDNETTGRSDIYEQQGDKFLLFDTKVWGSFRVARAFGLVKKGKAPDPSGATYKRAYKGFKPGDPKMIDVFECDPAQADAEDVTWQLNRYRLFYELMGFRVDEMWVQIIVRDGGLSSAKERGVTDKIYYLPVKRLSDDVVADYFKRKRDALYNALYVTHEVPPVCTEKERWENNGFATRCQYYCDVWEFCDYGRSQKQIKEG